MFYILLFALGGLLMVLVLRHDAGTIFGLEIDAFAQMGFLGALLVFISLGAFAGQRVGEVARNALAWLLIALGLVTIYAYKDELQQIAYDVGGTLIPGLAVPDASGGTITINRGLGGHFEVPAVADGTTVRMLVDTGASSVVLTAQDAERLGYALNDLDFDRPVSTANGMSFVAPITIESLMVGDIEVTNVRAAIARPDALDSSLLGLTFLDRLTAYEFRGGQLILRP